MRIACPQCDRGGRFTKARRVEPLDQLSGSFKQSILKSQAPPIKEPLLDTDTVIKVSSHEDKPPSRPLIAVRTGVSDSSNTRNSGPSISHMKSRIVSKRTPKERPERPQSTKSLLLPKSYCFSADGKTLILWTRGQDYFLASLIPENASEAPKEADLQWGWKKYAAPEVRRVVGGGSRFAAVCQVSPTFMFEAKD